MTDKVLVLHDADMNISAFIRSGDDILVLSFQQFLSRLATPHLNEYRVVEISFSTAEENDESWILLEPWRHLMDEEFDKSILSGFDRLFNFGVEEGLEWDKWEV